MLFHLLKEDFRHKPVINFILFVFIVFAVAFSSAGINNIVTAVSAQSEYCEKAGVMDYYLFAMGKVDSDAVAEKISTFSSISSYKLEEGLGLFKNNFITDTAEDADVMSIISAVPLESSYTKYFNSENQIMKAPEKGQIFVPQKLIDSKLFSIGESIRIQVGEKYVDVLVSETEKDAVFGSPSMGMNRILMSKEDYEVLRSDPSASAINNVLCAFSTDDEEGLIRELSELKLDPNVMTAQFSGDMLLLTNYLSYVISAAMVGLSLCMILIFMLVLSYTIRFTLSQEFREIGTMKAIGLNDRSISKLYLLKYYSMAVVAAVLGFIMSIPLGRLLLRSLEETIVVEGRNPWGVNLICAVAIPVIVLGFAARCMKKINAISPVEAVRNGAFALNSRHTSGLSLQKSRLPLSISLPFSDILGEKLHHTVLSLCITLCLVMTLIMSNTLNTICSKSMFSLMNMIPCDIVYNANDGYSSVENLDSILDEMDVTLKIMGLSTDVYSDVGWYMDLEKGNQKLNVTVMQGIRTDVNDYSYLEGSAPTGNNEIALAVQTAKKLDAQIGDTVMLNVGEEVRPMLVTALFQTMMNMGDGARIGNNAAPMDMKPVVCMGVQIGFNTPQSKKQLRAYMDELEEKYPDGKLYMADGYMDTMVGNISETIKMFRNAVAVLAVSVCILVAVLLEISVVEKEKAEIALMKAIGFRNSFIVIQHTIRTVLAAIPAIVLAVLLGQPAGKLTVGMAFRTMGLKKVVFQINPAEIYLVWPMVFLAAATIATLLISLRTCRITPSDTRNVE